MSRMRHARHGVVGLPPLLSVASAHGIDPDEALRRVGIAPSLLRDPRASVPVERVHALSRLLLDATGDPALGLDAGRRYHPSTFGLLGAVASIAPTVREVVRLFVDYAHLTFTFFVVDFVEARDDTGRILFVDGATLEPRLHRFYLDREVAFVNETARTFWPETHPLLLRAVELDYPEPAEAARYRRFFPCPVRFGAEHGAVVLDLAHDRPRAHANPLGLQLLKEHLRSFGVVRDGDGLVERVRREITVSIAARQTLPAIGRVAAAAGLSERALRRRLTAAGTSFRALTDETVTLLAKKYLRDSGRPVGDVARRLGYAESASFVRAFRRTTGTTPDAFRAAHRPDR